MLEFQKPIPVVVEGNKDGYAIYVTDSGMLENDIWCVVLCEGGIVRHYRSDQIRIFHNATFDIIKDNKDNPMNNKSAGVNFFNEAIKKYKPKLVFCGHMHEYQDMKKLHGVPVINPGDGEKGKAAIITLPENKKEKINIVYITGTDFDCEY